MWHLFSLKTQKYDQIPVSFQRSNNFSHITLHYVDDILHFLTIILISFYLIKNIWHLKTSPLALYNHLSMIKIIDCCSLIIVRKVNDCSFSNVNIYLFYLLWCWSDYYYFGCQQKDTFRCELVLQQPSREVFSTL